MYPVTPPLSTLAQVALYSSTFTFVPRSSVANTLAEVLAEA